MSWSVFSTISETGLGWTDERIATALSAGKRRDGRILAPLMPWHLFAEMTKSDVAALVADLRNLPPVKNQVPGPFGANEKPAIYVMQLAPPASDTAAATK